MPSTWCSTPAVANVRSALGTHASGTMSPTDPSAAKADRTALSAPGHNPEPSTGMTERLPGSSRTDVGADIPGAITGSSRAAKEMTAAGTRKPAVEHLQVRLGMPEVRQRDLPRRRGPWRRPLRDVAEHGRRSRGAPAADGPQLHRRQVLRLVEHDVPEARRPAEQVRQLVEQHHVGR